MNIDEELDKCTSMEDLTGKDAVTKAERDAGGKVRADLKAKGRLALGGGFQGSSEKDEDVERLHQRYPSLSTDQIKDRLKEIENLTAKK